MVRLPGSEVIIPMYINMHEQPLNMQTLTKNPLSQAENFFLQSKLLVFRVFRGFEQLSSLF